MPEFQRGNSTAFLNPAPPLDPKAAELSTPSARRPRTGTRPACDSFLEEYNRHMLQVLTIHEAYPGHYVQLEYANRNPVAGSPRAGLGRVHRRLGRLHASR